MSGLLTRQDAAAQLNVSLATVDRIVRSGRLRVVRFGPRTVRFRESDIAAFVAAHVSDQASVKKRRPTASPPVHATENVRRLPARRLWALPDPLAEE